MTGCSGERGQPGGWGWTWQAVEEGEEGTRWAQRLETSVLGGVHRVGSYLSTQEGPVATMQCLPKSWVTSLTCAPRYPHLRVGVSSWALWVLQKHSIDIVLAGQNWTELTVLVQEAPTLLWLSKEFVITAYSRNMLDTSLALPSFNYPFCREESTVSCGLSVLIEWQKPARTDREGWVSSS